MPFEILSLSFVPARPAVPPGTKNKMQASPSRRPINEINQSADRKKHKGETLYDLFCMQMAPSLLAFWVERFRNQDAYSFNLLKASRNGTIQHLNIMDMSYYHRMTPDNNEVAVNATDSYPRKILLAELPDNPCTHEGRIRFLESVAAWFNEHRKFRTIRYRVPERADLTPQDGPLPLLDHLLTDTSVISVIRYFYDGATPEWAGANQDIALLYFSRPFPEQAIRQLGYGDLREDNHADLPDGRGAYAPGFNPPVRRELPDDAQVAPGGVPIAPAVASVEQAPGVVPVVQTPDVTSTNPAEEGQLHEEDPCKLQAGEGPPGPSDAGTTAEHEDDTKPPAVDLQVERGVDEKFSAVEPIIDPPSVATRETDPLTETSVHTVESSSDGKTDIMVVSTATVEPKGAESGDPNNDGTVNRRRLRSSYGTMENVD